ncbi:SpoIIE family protein phosphatase [Peterkaempfera bronchialis]|uniref:GAF domain-containing protein n=1 Tax=Peterkaempfera bronchialis TaxID=2126346 RepID=A0A345SYE9_9ACTN|nr:SpoIIE family protein phosphatase [Peterkaempfera bronchialis]AXI78754.1 GAF domain-containing protein [Peterkaempfera bronchialis]
MARLWGRSRAQSAPTSAGRRPRSRPAEEPDRQPDRQGGRPPWRRRLRPLLSVRSAAGQVFVLQVVIVLLLVVVGAVALVLQSRADAAQDARDRSVAVAQTFASAPGVAQGLRSRDPTAALQPSAEMARKLAGVDFVTVASTQGIRYTHPVHSRIGQRLIGTIGPALRGHTVVQTVNGALGRLVQAVVPVRDGRGRVIGLVVAGITVKNIRSPVDRQLPLLIGSAAAALALATAGTALISSRLRRQTHGLGPAEMTRMYEHHDAVLHAVREGVLIVGGDGRLLLANDEARRLLDLPPDAEGRQVTDLGLEPRTAELLASGRVATDEVIPAGDRLLAVNNRPTDRNGGPPGSVATLRDSTELRALSGRAEGARERLRLLYDASVDIGTTLDVVRTAEELARVAVPRFADLVNVDLVEAVLSGEEPRGGTRPEMRRVAVHSASGENPLYLIGDVIRYIPESPQAAAFASGRAVLEPDLRDCAGWRAQHPANTDAALAAGLHSLITAPLLARGVLLGSVHFYRWERPGPFEEDDLSLAEELAARAAVCIDNARRYTREHAVAVTLQRSLLPRSLPEQNALDVAYRYLPAHAGVGGDWFDVIPLPGARVALVVGDVVGHGLHAAATMGRLRTAVHNFSALDLPPDELLGHLDELVARIDQDERSGEGDTAVTGASCLYAIYDPVSGGCTLARAGHPLPALVRPDGTVSFPELPPGPPLGLGGMPFETAELYLPEGSRLVLYTDGLVETRSRDIDIGLDLLRGTLARTAERTPEEICTAVLDALLPEDPGDDIALLVARTRTLPADRVADWEVPSDPAAVARVRAAVTEKLAEWGLDEVAFTTELVLSELITNAIRHATGPIRVRLIRDRSLICEVADTSSTSPHLRYAATTDEGGRGIFLVAQFAERWGTRYTADGKVIWAEQPLSGPG